MSSFTLGFISLHEGKFPNVASVNCCLVATANNPVCGCIHPGFIQSAKGNRYGALVNAGKDPEKYRETMLTLGGIIVKISINWKGVHGYSIPLSNVVARAVKLMKRGFMKSSHILWSNIAQFIF